MDNKELTAAANSLIEWFNATATKPSEARAIMSKVQAKLIVGDTLSHTSGSLEHALNSEMTRLANDINDRLLIVSRKPR